MVHEALIIVEILIIVAAPLILLYLNGKWSQRSMYVCLLTIPILWYFVYSPIHELSHIAGTYMMGGRVTSFKLIPSFWKGEFGHAWITSEGLTESWQQLVSTVFPYFVDVVCIAAGIFLLRRNKFKKPFVVGFLFMMLCLRPAFDFMCESIAFLLGTKGDLYCINETIGGFFTWTFLISSIGLSLFSIVIIVRRYNGAPENLTVSGH